MCKTEDSQECWHQTELYGHIESILEEYIPHQLLKEAKEKRKNIKMDGRDIVQFYLNNSNNKLRMYGNDEDLERNLTTFWNFPTRRKMFRADCDTFCKAYPEVFPNSRDELFSCKQDYVQCLLYTIQNKYQDRFLPQKLDLYLKDYKKRLDGSFEFVKFDEKRFDEIRNLFDHFFLSDKYTGDPELLKSFSVQENLDDVEVLKKIISLFPSIFLLNNETKDKNATIVVRVFETGHDEFVMESELFNAINYRNPNSAPLKCKDPEGYLKTISKKEALRKYRDQITEVEFVYSKMFHADHAAVPIPTPSGDHCIMASNALFEVFHRVISVLDVFQKMKRNMWNMVVKYVSMLEKYFPPDMKSVYFIDLKIVKQLHLETEKFWNFLEKKSAKRVRDVKTDEFTIEDLKKELKTLGVTDVLAEATSNVKHIFMKDISLKGTAGMFTLLEKCQLLCVFDRFLSIRKTLHYQMVCGLIPIATCEFCNERMNGSTAEEESEDVEESNNTEDSPKDNDILKSEDSVEVKKVEGTPKTENSEIFSAEDLESTLLPTALKDLDNNSKKMQECVQYLKSLLKLLSEKEDTTWHKVLLPPLLTQALVVAEVTEERAFEINELKKYTASAIEAKEMFDKLNERIISSDEKRDRVLNELLQEKLEWVDLRNILTIRENQNKDVQLKLEQSLEAERVEKKKCQGVEKKLKETQDEMKKFKKISLEILEKKNEEIQKLKNGESLMKKNEEMEELKQGHQKILQEKYQILEDVKKEMRDLEQNLKEIKQDKEKIHVAHLKMVHKKEEELEKLLEGKKVLEEKAKKTDDLEKQMKEIQKEITKKNEEVEKLKHANLKLIKGKEEEIEKMRKHQTQEIKEKKKEVDHLKVENMQFSNEKRDLKLRIKEKEETEAKLTGDVKKLNNENRHLKKTVTQLEKTIEIDQLKMAMKLNMLETEISEKDKVIKELQEKTKPNKFACPLQSYQTMRDRLDITSLLDDAMEQYKKIISSTDRPEIRKLAWNEYLQYEGRLRKYQKAIEMNIQLLERPENVGIAVPIPDFPTFPSHFTAECYSAILEQDKENLKHNFN